MRTLTPVARRLDRIRSALSVVGVIGVFALLAGWGGTARPGPLFVVGVAVLLLLLSGLGMAIWWLLASPMPDTQRQGSGSPEQRRLSGALIVAAGLMFSLGLLWDEVWHRRFGGFGDDFLWPPHLLLYASLGIIAAVALTSLLSTGRGRKGLRERFRAEPVLGLLGLLAAFLTVSAPSDQLWHRIYGVDITAWSLPHLMLFGGVAVVLFATVPLLRSTVPSADWRRLEGMRVEEWLAVVAGGIGVGFFIQLGTTEWDGIGAVPDLAPADAFQSAFWARPEWLYPVVLVTIVFFCGPLLQGALRRVGVATLAGLISLALRLVANVLFGGGEVGMSVRSQLLALLGLAMVDLWAHWRLTRSGRVDWSITGAALAGGAYLAVLLPLVAALLTYPRVNGATLPGMIVWGLVMATGASWLGARLGDWLDTLGLAPTSQPPRRTGAAVLALLGAVVAVAVMVITADPPTG